MQKINKFEHLSFSRYSAAIHFRCGEYVIRCFVANLTDFPAVIEF